MERDSITGFKVKFNILDYADILPDAPNDPSDIINWDKASDDSVWVRQEPEKITPEYIQQEVTRVLRTGVWIFINLQPIWIPPNYYFFLQYFKVGGEYAQFRLSRLKSVYFHLRVLANPHAIGTFTIKSRQIGETSFEMSNALYEAADGVWDIPYGTLAIQSKTRETVINSCWRVLTAGWQSIPKWLKEVLYWDFTSGDNIATRLKFGSEAKGDDRKRDVLITYGSSTDNAFDSMNNMRVCYLDENLKWRENSFYSTFLNYEKFIAPGRSRRGLFKIFSSPADFECNSSEEGLQFWKDSNPDELNENGTTRSRVFRYYASPLEGLHDYYDKFGDADADEILADIKLKRGNVPKDKQLGEIRAHPLNEQEMFSSTEGGKVFSNIEGIKNRITYLTGIRFKDEYSKEPVKIWGIHEREDGNMQGMPVWRPSGKTYFDEYDSRCYYISLPEQREELKDVFTPPNYIEDSLGVDPFNFSSVSKTNYTPSNGAMVNFRFMDLYNTGFLKVPTFIYCMRTQYIETFYEDIIKAAIYNRAMIQIENKDKGFEEYCRRNGYLKWLLPSMGETFASGRFGDAPSGGKNAFLNEGLALINANTNLPLTPDDPYLLENHWSIELLQSYADFDPKNTQKSDLSMAAIQSHLGAIKMLNKKVRKPSAFNGYAYDYVLS